MTHHEITALDVMDTKAPSTTCTDCGADLHKAAEIAAGICVRCYRQRQMDGWELLRDGTHVPSTRRIRHGYSETPCACGNHWDLDEQGRCLACRASAGLWRSVALENAVDDRDHIANDLAEEIEEREREEEEFLYEMTLLQTEGERCPPF